MKPLRFALVGEKVGYSRSADIFAAMLEQLGLEGRLDILSVAKSELHTCTGHLIDEGYSGFAVTIPHKQEIIEHLDSLDDQARVIGAVNSVTIRNGSLIGHNTDCDGFSYALQKLGIFHDSRALILGCGGAARAVAFALSRDFGVSQFVVVGRRAERLSSFVSHLQRWPQPPVVTAVADLSELRGQNLDCSLVVNCTPAGGPNHSNESAIPNGFDWSSTKLFFDLNYNGGNEMLSGAQRAGVATTDGSLMLTAQAVRSLELWTGLTVEIDPVYHKVFQRVRS